MKKPTVRWIVAVVLILVVVILAAILLSRPYAEEITKLDTAGVPGLSEAVQSSLPDAAAIGPAYRVETKRVFRDSEIRYLIPYIEAGIRDVPAYGQADWFITPGILCLDQDFAPVSATLDESILDTTLTVEAGENTVLSCSELLLHSWDSKLSVPLQEIARQGSGDYVLVLGVYTKNSDVDRDQPCQCSFQWEGGIEFPALMSGVTLEFEVSGTAGYVNNR